MATKNPAFGELLRHPASFFAFGMGSGLAPVMPGTFGTVAALPIFCLLRLMPQAMYLATLVIAFLVGIALCDIASRRLGVHDHGGIVWDEFVGLWLALAFIPFEWPWILAGFLIFRAFDMIKPWPISWLDKRVHGGLGIMLDDILAALATIACLEGIRFIL